MKRTGEPISLSSVENIGICVDARALEAYAQARGVSMLDLSKGERMQFITEEI